MKPSLLLRIAAIITLLFFAGHTSGIPWTPAVGPGELPVIEAMKSHSFEALGSTRTYWDYYFGFGVIISLYLLLQAVVLWQIAALAKHDAVRLRPIIASFFVAFCVNALLAFKFFFFIPVVMSVVIAIVLALAFYAAGRRRGTVNGEL
jgi:hypothetical protein